MIKYLFYYPGSLTFAKEVVDAATLIRSNGVKTFTADLFRVALQTMKSKDEPFREEQKTDEFIEIET